VKIVNSFFNLKKTLIYSFLIIFSSTLFLFSPEPKETQSLCGYYFEINSYAGFVVNCDAGVFCTSARHPANLLKANAIRQSRPLYIILGTLIGYPINFLFNVLDINLDQNIYDSNEATPYIPFYIGFILINFIILFISIFLFDSILTSMGISKYLIYLLSMFLICNDVIKAFIWTAHSQIFNIFSPIFIIFIMWKIISDSSLSNKKIFIISFIGGLLLLVHGNFILFLPCILFSLLLRKKLKDKFRIGAFTKIASMASIIFAIPIIIWIITVTISAGYYYNHEIVRWRQVVWILDTLKIGINKFIEQFLIFTSYYFKTFSYEILPFIVFSVVLYIILYFYRQINTNSAKVNIKYTLFKKIVFLNFIGYFIFFWLLGGYSTRLTFTIVAPLLFYIAVELDYFIKKNQIFRKIILSGLSVSVVLWIVFHVVKYGPFT